MIVTNPLFVLLFGDCTNPILYLKWQPGNEFFNIYTEIVINSFDDLFSVTFDHLLDWE